MSSAFKSFLRSIAALSAAAGAVWMTHVAALHSMRVVERCDRPCQWDPKNGFASCEPLRADLEIMTTPEPIGNRTAVWYRATLTNRSCRTIDFGPDFFQWNNDSWARIREGYGGRVIIWDAVGHALKSDLQDLARNENGIIPYRYETRDVEPHLLRQTILGRELVRLSLQPGQAVSTSFSVLKPFQWKLGSAQTTSGERYWKTPESVHLRNLEGRYAVPPQGFRRLVDYRLAGPGDYSAQFAFDDQIESSRFDDPRTPIRNLIRRWVYFLATGWDVDTTKSIRISARSPVVHFRIGS